MKQERERELIARLSIMQKLSLGEAMELLGISESTARRMFAKLEQEGAAIRTHGGLRSVTGGLPAYSFERLAQANIEKKTAIARAAVQAIVDGDVIFCDSGTTIQCLCAELLERVTQERLHIQLYTNSLANLELLSPAMPVNLVGGEYRAFRKDFYGYLAEQALGGLYFTKSFLGTDGCAACAEFTTTDFDTARMNQIAIRNTSETYLLTDSSKFTTPSHVAYAPVDRFYSIITDSAIRPDLLARLEKNGARVRLVETAPPLAVAK